MTDVWITPLKNRAREHAVQQRQATVEELVKLSGAFKKCWDKPCQ